MAEKPFNSSTDISNSTNSTPPGDAAAVMENESDYSALFRSLAQEFIAEPYPSSGLRPLRRQVKKALRVLRHSCRRPSPASSSTCSASAEAAFREWLDDNYHLLMREGVGVLSALRFADDQPCNEDGLPSTCSLLYKLIAKIGVTDADGFEELIDIMQKVRPLTVFELEQLPLCLRAALILTAAEACRQSGYEAERLISLAVRGLRQTVGLDFGRLTERHSIVERILRDDPAGVYPLMDETSRAEYRRGTALAAQHSGHSEAATAAEFIDQARQGAGPRERHVGAALLAAGDSPRRRNRGRVLLVSTLLIPAFAAVALAVWVNNPWLVPLFYLPLVECFRPLLQQLLLRRLPPRRLPRLELNGVIPEEARTVITVSTLLPGAQSAAKTAEKLFRLYNTNGQGAVQICLLADLPQAKYPTLPRDEADIAAMRREISRLNSRTNGCFIMAVRRREFSPTMNIYTGQERKRGAIGELIRVIQGGPSRFLALEGDVHLLRRAKYVLALDADTGMLLDTAAQLVGTAMHPLVHAQISPDRRRVLHGYGVLVPRLGAELHSANRTAFSRAMAGVGGITPYDVPSGDLYMDCFQSAIFTGKGLIDVEAFTVMQQAEFPPEQVLSHDILEGCLLHTGLVSDVEMTDGCPASMGSWLDRLHRWIRGDWQNLSFIFNDRWGFTRLDRWKLLDNLRRSITPIMAMLCILLSLAVPGRGGQWLALVGLLTPIAGNLLSAALSLIHGGWMTLGGRYYSRVLPRALSALTQAWYALVMLPATALANADAALRACVRLITRRNLLEWTTAAQAEKRKGGWLAGIRRFWLTVAIAVVLLVFGAGFARLGGLIFLMLLPFAVFSERISPPGGGALLTAVQKEQLSDYAAAMWRYYEQFCTPEEHDLPPDNVQESPVWRVAHRTSPTNIGLYLLCVAAAHDFGLVDTEEMLRRIEATVATIERMEKWKGNLLNWYDTRSLRPMSPRYVSAVDSGNFACCLVALRQALKELSNPRAEALAARIRLLQEAIDLSPMYNPHRALFHIGLDPDSGERSPSYYDLLMSESRMTGYFAIATRTVPKKHWGALGRTLTRTGNAIGPVSWTGTMFEYFMPRLLLPAEEGTMGYEALRFCLHCQRRRPPRGVPWGISESGFYAFDGNLNYQYKAHGVPRLALKRGMGADLVISPYSSFLALTTDPTGAMRNLEKLERLGLTGSCGFYEAADYTAGRAAHGGYSVVRSYMAHHVGMSLIACANALTDDVFVRRFLRDDDMARAMELTFEKAPNAGTVFDPPKENSTPEVPGRRRQITEEIRHSNPRTPRMHLLAGSEWQLAITDTGAGISSSRGLDIHRFSDDLLRSPQGIFVMVDNGEGAFSITHAPGYRDESTVGGESVPIERRAEFETGAAIFTAQRGALEAGMRAMVHPRLPCEQRQVVVKNHSGHRVTAAVLCYLEPSLAKRDDAQAHPAFSRIFLSSHKDDAANALYITRRQRLGEPPSCLAVGLLEDREFEHEPSREKLLERPMGLDSLDRVTDMPLSGEGEGIPDSAVAMRAKLELPPHTQRTVTFVLVSAPTVEEAGNRLIEVRREGQLTAEKAASSPFGGVEADLAAQILPDIFYPPRISREWVISARRNTQGQSALWSMGISGDYPLILVEIHNAADASRTEPYMRLHRSLLMGGVTTELAIAYREGGDYQAPVLEAIREAAHNAGSLDVLGKRGGVHPVNLLTHGEEALNLLTAVCVHNGARDLKRTGVLSPDYHAAPILPVKRRTENDENHEAGSVKATIPGGFFAEDRFTVTGNPRLPWCHVLANPTFGTLVSDKALGFTWAVNSRENKLTPWTNDTAADNRGELLLLRTGGCLYDAVWGAEATFGDGFARYNGRQGGLAVTVTVRVPARGPWKTVTLTLENPGEETMDVQAAYYTEPVLGVNRRHARHTVAHWEQGALLLHNPFASVKGTAILTAVGGADGCDCDRGSFLTGAWGGGTLSPLPDPCAAVIVRRRLPPRRRESVTFVLGFAAGSRPEVSRQAAKRLPALAADAPPLSVDFPQVRTPDPLLNALVSRWMPWQALVCRIYARTGFYQCGGAWGFRDQLQDSLAALWFRPEVTRRQLLRCAAVQFEEGDVLHWWYDMPGALQGVRTHCSDDLVWLPYVTAEYVAFTGDDSVLDNHVRWLTAAPLRPDEKDRYFKPSRTDYADSVYEHCLRALECACTHGEHGLPLIGSGDWNDGFSLLGVQGRGESVWMAMFLSMTLERFAPLCERRGDPDRAARYRDMATDYRRCADACFAGDRYLRAFFDDGSPLGAPDSGDGSMDSLSQSFAVLCGLPLDRANKGLDSALNQLVDRRHGVVKLLAPPFSRAPAEERQDARQRLVGYISAYPPGLRENGGQYTHAAVWLAIALLEAGRADEGAELLRLLSTAHKYADGLGDRYQGEPYALAGDVYAHPECEGRAGWTQYTGSAGWYYTAVLRHLLGLTPLGDRLQLRPHLPSDWPTAEVHITLGRTPLTIRYERGEPALTVDGQPAAFVPLDGAPHEVTLTVDTTPASRTVS